jgi:hypothetical protein
VVHAWWWAFVVVRGWALVVVRGDGLSGGRSWWVVVVVVVVVVVCPFVGAGHHSWAVVAGRRRFWVMVVVCERWRSFWVVEVVLGGGSRSFWGRCRRGPFVEPAVCCGDVAPFLSSLVVGVCRGGGGPSTTVVCHVVTATWR